MNEKYNVLVTYDIEQYHTQVRKRLIDNFGFEEVMIGDNNTKCYLPNTTLFKKNTKKEESLEIVQSVCNSLNANLKRCICTKCDNWIALVGEEL